MDSYLGKLAAVNPVIELILDRMKKGRWNIWVIWIPEHAFYGVRVYIYFGALLAIRLVH